MLSQLQRQNWMSFDSWILKVNILYHKGIFITLFSDLLDVNVASPDEKSVLTYVASLWEVFPVLPEPPAEVLSC